MIVNGDAHINLYGVVVRTQMDGRWYGPIPADEVKA
jgi:hypothetical protein